MTASKSKAEARKQLKQFGRTVYCGCEIWETASGDGRTGLYRVAPAGRREEYHDHTPNSVALRAALRIAESVAR